MSRFHITLFILFLFPTIFGVAQSSKKIKKSAAEALAKKDYYNALSQYKTLYQRDSMDLEVIYNYAEALRGFNDYAGAELQYARAFKIDKGKEYPHALFWLAMMQKQNGKYLEAKKNFKKAHSKYKKDKSSYFYLKADKELTAIDEALLIIKEDSADVKIRNISEINTPFAEYSIFPVNDSLLYIAALQTDSGFSGGSKFSRLYHTQKIDSLWSKPELLPGSVNVEGHHAANAVLHPSGNEMYFSLCQALSECYIYRSRREGNGWQAPEKLPEAVNQAGATTTHPSITTSGDTVILLFSSNRSGGKGSMDIWYSRIEKASFSMAAPLPAINSIEDEVTPFYSHSDSTLYFSSNWHSGLGGFDIFKAKGTLNSLKEVKNLGLPFNTAANDFYYAVAPSGKESFLSSNRKGSMVIEGETCCNDFYQITHPVKDTIDTLPSVSRSLAELNKYIPLTLYFHNDEPDARTTDTVTSKSYPETFREYIQLRDQYRREYSKGLQGEQQEEAELDIDLFFDNYVVKGYNELEKFTQLLLEAMRNGFEITLTIKGYASTLAKSDYNVQLTKRRISSLKNHLSRYKNGVFHPYIKGTSENGGRLKFQEIPFGEYKASTLVSDNLNDLKNSVYSRKAALERKIEIIAVSVTDTIVPENTATAQGPPDPKAISPQTKTESPVSSKSAGTGAAGTVKFKSVRHDFGTLKYGTVATHSFIFTNTGSKPVTILGANANCGCTIPSFTSSVIAPGKEGEIKVSFDTKGKLGENVNYIQVITDGDPRQVILTITSTVKVQ